MHRSSRFPNAFVGLMLVSCRNCGRNRSIIKDFTRIRCQISPWCWKKWTFMSRSHTLTNSVWLVTHAYWSLWPSNYSMKFFCEYQIGWDILWYFWQYFDLLCLFDLRFKWLLFEWKIIFILGGRLVRHSKTNDFNLITSLPFASLSFKVAIINRLATGSQFNLLYESWIALSTG